MPEPMHTAFHQSNVSFSAITLSVLPTEICHLKARQEECDDQGTKTDGMAQGVFWPVQRGKMSAFGPLQ